MSNPDWAPDDLLTGTFAEQATPEERQATRPDAPAEEDPDQGSPETD